MPDNQTAKMPKYRSHKVVHALKIRSARHNTLEFDDVGEKEVPGWSPRSMSNVWWERHKPEAGGYYVVYEDGYDSYSPAAAFEAGYTRIDEWCETDEERAARDALDDAVSGRKLPSSRLE